MGLTAARPSLDLTNPSLHAVAVPSSHVHYDRHGRVEVPRRRVLRIVLIVAAVVMIVWLIGLVIGYTLFNVGGSVPGTGTGDIVTTP
jgi:ferric-dicitrate binding protein FerR (iron transport regulator)